MKRGFRALRVGGKCALDVGATVFKLQPGFGYMLKTGSEAHHILPVVFREFPAQALANVDLVSRSVGSINFTS